MNTLQDYAKQVWLLSTVEDKKLVLKEMVMNFSFKRKQAAFLQSITNLNSVVQLDQLAANIILVKCNM